MAIDTKGVPASVAALTTPPPAPKDGLALTWRFTNGDVYSLIVEEGALKTIGYGRDWQAITPDGRTVTVYAAHVMAFEQRNTPIKARKVTSDG